MYTLAHNYEKHEGVLHSMACTITLAIILTAAYNYCLIYILLY